MEKLIELLNEYDKIKWDKEEPIYNWKIAIKTKIYQTYLVSARYWFIKWLVENDKIEWETIWNYQSRTKLRTLTHTAWLWHDAEWKSELEYIKETFTDGLLMLLSISSSPIDDLISYLR